MSSIRTLTRNLFNTSLPAVLVYFSIMFIGGCLARVEKKPATVAAYATPSPGIPVDGYCKTNDINYPRKHDSGLK